MYYSKDCREKQNGGRDNGIPRCFCAFYSTRQFLYLQKNARKAYKGVIIVLSYSIPRSLLTIRLRQVLAP